MKKLPRFLGWIPVILVGILGAYIVFHMWQLTEIGRTGSHHRTIVKDQSTDLAGQQKFSSATAERSPGASPSAEEH